MTKKRIFFQAFVSGGLALYFTQLLYRAMSDGDSSGFEVRVAATVCLMCAVYYVAKGLAQAMDDEKDWDE